MSRESNVFAFSPKRPSAIKYRTTRRGRVHSPAFGRRRAIFTRLPVTGRRRMTVNTICPRRARYKDVSNPTRLAVLYHAYIKPYFSNGRVVVSPLLPNRRIDYDTGSSFFSLVINYKNIVGVSRNSLIYPRLGCTRTRTHARNIYCFLPFSSDSTRFFLDRFCYRP